MVEQVQTVSSFHFPHPKNAINKIKSAFRKSDANENKKDMISRVLERFIKNVLTIYLQCQLPSTSSNLPAA